MGARGGFGGAAALDGDAREKLLREMLINESRGLTRSERSRFGGCQSQPQLQSTQSETKSRTETQESSQFRGESSLWSAASRCGGRT